ncbi:hypothetical protein AB0M43_37325 [Longispora sp. NPDC051575]|uniref:hypothetical protein n=1 Tax=Longispora sp. NPDC051575 TaxID=3154943 RepID=UPI00343D1129
MPRPMWKGSISFGLVTIPVHAAPASGEKDFNSGNLGYQIDLNARGEADVALALAAIDSTASG